MTVPPPSDDEDELFTEDPDMESPDQPEASDAAQTAVEAANQYHNMIDAAKRWSRQTATDLRIASLTADDTDAADRFAEAAVLVDTVFDRVEEGDATRTRRAA